jgi:hypothetical protein
LLAAAAAAAADNSVSRCCLFNACFHPNIFLQAV